MMDLTRTLQVRIAITACLFARQILMRSLTMQIWTKLHPRNLLPITRQKTKRLQKAQRLAYMSRSRLSFLRVARIVLTRHLIVRSKSLLIEKLSIY